MNIRHYVEASDYPEICRWARHDFQGKEPQASQFSKTSFVAQDFDSQIAGVLSVMLTNCKHYCILECLFTNPDLPTRVRKEAIESLSLYATAFAKALEYKGLLCFTEKEAMARHYKKLGFQITLENTFTLYKPLGE